MPASQSPVRPYYDRKENARRILTFIRKYDAETGLSPTIVEIAAGCYMSRSNVVRYLDWLEAWGFLTRIPHVPRSIVLLKTNRRL